MSIADILLEIDADGQHDLDQIPALDPGHRDYERRNEERLRTRLQSEKNQLNRFIITMEHRTYVYTALVNAADGAPVKTPIKANLSPNQPAMRMAASVRG